MHPGDGCQGPDGEKFGLSLFQKTLGQTGTRAEVLQFGKSASIDHQVAMLVQNSRFQGLLWSGIRWTAEGSLPQPWQEQAAPGPPGGGRIMAGWGLAVWLLGEWQDRGLGPGPCLNEKKF